MWLFFFPREGSFFHRNFEFLISFKFIEKYMEKYVYIFLFSYENYILIVLHFLKMIRKRCRCRPSKFVFKPISIEGIYGRISAVNQVSNVPDVGGILSKKFLDFP